MGNWFSSDTDERIKQLEQKIDTNNDNIVTKSELDHYFKMMSDKIDKNGDGVVSKTELELYVNSKLNNNSETEKWKQAYEKLYDTHVDLLDQVKGDQPIEIESNISEKALKDYIKTEIIDTDANLGLIPDALEKKIYLTVYKTIAKSLESLFNNTNLDTINHRVRISINPIPLEERKSHNKK